MDAQGNPTIYTYDARDFLVEIRQRGEKEERITQYEQDAFGQITAMRDELGQEERYAYDSLGRLVEKRDKEGYTTAWSYTPMGQIGRIRYGDGKEVNYTYNLLGQLEGMKDWLGETTLE